MKRQSPLKALTARNRRCNELRREAREMWDLRSPFKQGLYIVARLIGQAPETAIETARRRPS